MRIRKRAKISTPPPPPPSQPPLPPPPPSISIVPNPPVTHVCQLNRSPWDVISFTSQSQEDYGFQIKLDDDDTCNSIKREPVDGLNSISPSKEQYWAKYWVKKVKKDEGNRPSLVVDVDKVKAKKKNKVIKKEEPDYNCCTKTDGKGWFCKKEAKEGEVLCEHHIEQLKSYQFNYQYSCRKATRPKPVVARKAKSEVTTKAKPEEATATTTAPSGATTTTTTMASKKRNRGKVSSPSPMDFYYYSGFGPKYSWGSRRRGEGGEKKIKGIKNEEQQEDTTDDHDTTNITQTQASSSLAAANIVDHNNNYEQNNDDVFDDFDDDEDDEYNGDNNRVRRPIKARSLKSIL